MKKALIIGASGQAGSYLSELLIRKNYEVIGTGYSRTCGMFELETVLETKKWCPTLEMVDVRSLKQIQWCIERHSPDEVYNLAARMFAPASWQNPVEYMQVNALAVGQMLETLYKINPKAKFFQAGSAEIFDRVFPLDEKSPIKPRNPYGVSKATAQELVRVYREEKGMFACTGILFNMESPRRTDNFFSVKVATAAARIKAGLQEKLIIGQLDAMRDWGWTEEYVEAMWLMLQAKTPDDYVIGTGTSKSCLDFVIEAFDCVGLSMDKVCWEDNSINPKPTDDVLMCNPRKIEQALHWKAKTHFKDVVRKLVEAEVGALEHYSQDKVRTV